MAGGQYPVKPGRTILEILRDELCYHESADGEYENVPGLQYAINVITSPYSYPKRPKNNVVSIEEWKSR